MIKKIVTDSGKADSLKVISDKVNDNFEFIVSAMKRDLDFTAIIKEFNIATVDSIPTSITLNKVVGLKDYLDTIGMLVNENKALKERLELQSEQLSSLQNQLTSLNSALLNRK